MEDIIEELVGEIWDEHDEVIEEVELLGENEFKVMAATNLDKVFRMLSITDEETDATTVGGWVIEQLGRVPKQGDHFVYDNLSVTISKTNSRRVLELMLRLDEDEVQDE